MELYNVAMHGIFRGNVCKNIILSHNTIWTEKHAMAYEELRLSKWSYQDVWGAVGLAGNVTAVLGLRLPGNSRANRINS